MALRCERPSAREARAAVRTDVMALAARLGARMLPECPLHPDHDHLREHEAQKKPLTQWQWRCGICGKLFRSEHYLDLHLERRHADTLPHNASLCLGEFCDILRCPTWLEAVRQQHRHAQATACRRRELDARRHFCQHMVHDCFEPTGEGKAHAVFEGMDEYFCRPLSCEWRQRLGRGDAAAVPTQPDAAQHTGYYVLGFLVLGALCVLYLGTLCWYAETKTSSARLRPRHGRRRAGWWWQSKPKEY